jgi:hypothetical protein
MTPSGKIPSTDDPRIGPAWGETASLLSNFIPLGGPMTGVGAMAIPMAAKVARRAALSMDTAARMARAAEMGFVTDLPLYQGTDRAFSAFDLSKGGAMTGVAPPRLAVWASPDPEIAGEFATMPHKRTAAAPQVYPLLHRAEKKGHWKLRGDETNEEVAATLAQAWDDGFDAVMLHNYTSPGGRSGSILAVKDPAQLRSPFARFDPAKRNSANLLAGIADVGILPPIFGTIDPAALRLSNQSASGPSP